VTEAVAILGRHARSFRLAGRLLPQADLRAAAELYAFCRAVDDIADELPDRAAARESLGLLASALRDAEARHPLAEQLAPLVRSGLHVEPAALLVETVLQDIGLVRLADEAALLRYAHGAAGTVGIMMCDVLGVTHPAALPHAVDLGMAMQLTNIARDVAEDAARDRLYLPAECLPAGYGPADVQRTPAPAFAAVARVIARAGRHYRSAERGYRYLPVRVRPAIRTAARLYEAIGSRLLLQGPAYLATGQRCVVPRWQRLALVGWCLLPCPPAAPHDTTLHDPLRGVLGAHA